MPIAIVEKRLSTADLLRREDHFKAQALPQVGHVLERFGIELVAEAGDEKLGLGHKQFGIR